MEIVSFPLEAEVTFLAINISAIHDIHVFVLAIKLPCDVSCVSKDIITS